MNHRVSGIKRPTKTDIEEHDGKIRDYTEYFLGGDFDSEESYKILPKVLYSANTLLNYYRQSPMGGGSKRRRESVGTPNDSDSKCTPWYAVQN